MKAAVVTGASSGIGLALARLLTQTGWLVVGLDIAPAAALSGAYEHFEVDLCDQKNLRSVLASLRPRAPSVALVHCAGVMRCDDSQQMSGAAGDNLWRLHVAAAHILIENLSPSLCEQQGRIVLLSSRARDGRAGRALYAASKAALDGLVRSWASTLIARGITVNAISPAAVDTPMLHDPARAGAPVRPLPIGRLITPDEVAQCIAYLLGPHAGAITGQTITICGGASLITG